MISETEHPCFNETQGSACCQMGTEVMDHNLEAIMKVMRIAIGRSKSRINMTEIVGAISIDGKYPMKLSNDHLKDLQLEKDPNAMIPYCSLSVAKDVNGEDPLNPECQLFNPVISDLGLCHSFNAKRPKDMLSPSYFADSFDRAFSSDYSVTTSTWNGTGSGEDHSLTFYLLDSSVRKMKRSHPSFYHMGISTQTNYFDMVYTNELIKPGFHTIWKVQAMENVPSKNLHNIPIEKRNCKFHDEASDLDIFKVYSKKACEFECGLKEAFKMCGCFPWYIPPPASKNRHTLCDVFGNYCFKKSMKRVRSSGNCACLPT